MEIVSILLAALGVAASWIGAYIAISGARKSRGSANTAECHAEAAERSANAAEVTATHIAEIAQRLKKRIAVVVDRPGGHFRPDLRKINENTFPIQLGSIRNVGQDIVVLKRARVIGSWADILRVVRCDFSVASDSSDPASWSGSPKPLAALSPGCAAACRLTVEVRSEPGAGIGDVRVEIPCEPELDGGLDALAINVHYRPTN